MTDAALKKELASLVRRPSNAACADCHMPSPTWASFNIGIFICMTCAGHHRSLGTHISRVRSITLDHWDAAAVQTMASIGNERANRVWEAKLRPGQRIHPGVDDAARAEFIRMKYVHRAFYADAAQLQAIEQKQRQQQAAGGASGTSTSMTSDQPRPMSKVEQRQARLQARLLQQQQQQQQVQRSNSTEPVAPPQPTRQSSSPLPSTSSPTPSPAAAAAAEVPNLFSGIAVSSHATSAYAQSASSSSSSSSSSAASSSPSMSSNGPSTPSCAVSPKPLIMSQPAAARPAARVHSASPWVSKNDFKQPKVATHHHHHHTANKVNSNTSNVPSSATPQPSLLDILSTSTSSSSSSMSASAEPASQSHGVDDMFAGLSVSEGSNGNSATTQPFGSAAAPSSNSNANNRKNELLDFYSHEPASAPARSQCHPQHPSDPSPASSISSNHDMFAQLQTRESASASPPTQGSASSFDFLQESSTEEQSNAAESSNDAAAGASAFSFLSDADESSNGTLPPSSAKNRNLADGFAHLLGDTNDVPVSLDMSVPASNSMSGGDAISNGNVAFDPNLALANSGMGMGMGTMGMGMNMDMNMDALLDPSLNANLNMNMGMGMPGMGMAMGMSVANLDGMGSMPLGMGSVHMASNGTAMNGSMMNGLSSSPASAPHFTVHSTQASVSVDASNDPFAHITSSSSSSASSSSSIGFMSPSPSPLTNHAPKQADECDMDGCRNKKVARGLCSKHIRESNTNATNVHAPTVQSDASPSPLTSASSTSSFDFLADSNKQLLQQQSTSTIAASTSTSNFDFVASTTAAAPQESQISNGGGSSFDFL